MLFCAQLAHTPLLQFGADLLWICCTTSCTTNPQQIYVMEFVVCDVIVASILVVSLAEIGIVYFMS